MNDYKTMFSRIESDIKRHDDIDLLCRLVEKATPMKPKMTLYKSPYMKKERVIWICPDCERYYDLSTCNFCPHCGQAIDGSDVK